jgi:hypothetical protein
MIFSLTVMEVIDLESASALSPSHHANAIRPLARPRVTQASILSMFGQALPSITAPLDFGATIVKTVQASLRMREDLGFEFG